MCRHRGYAAAVDQAERAEALVGLPLLDVDGRTVGVVDEVFFSRRTGEPGFAVVRDVAIPLDGASIDHDAILVPYARDDIDRAPVLAGDLDSATADRVRGHFAARAVVPDPTTTQMPPTVDGTSGLVDPGAGDETAEVPPAERFDPGPETAEVDLHEEQIVVDTRRKATERVVLRKRVVTEEVTISVTVRREELVIDREPLDPAEVVARADGDRRLEEGELEFLLYEEEPVVSTRVVPSERVRVRREAVPEEQIVTGQIRREEADVEQISTQEEHERL
jgi:uncharacterized protein (TIGR02271 family)